MAEATSSPYLSRRKDVVHLDNVRQDGDGPEILHRRRVRSPLAYGMGERALGPQLHLDLHEDR
eukprot:11193153-Lingulodinium_polyedra.AAC.1